MKNLFLFAVLICLITNAAFAQSNTPSANYNFHDLSVLKMLPKQSRDSLIRAMRKSNKELAKQKTVDVNGKSSGGKIAKLTKDYYGQMSAMMIQVLENPDDATTRLNERKFERLQSKFEFEMELYTEEQNYLQERKQIIDDFNSEDFEDAEDRRDARKDMKEELKDLEEDYKDTIKDLKDERKDQLEKEAERDSEDV
ncbi:hypothetical protein LT679_06605 [Mucilaginibacter roseus]|uniref:DUF4890 domain-containing protein n=1 Tax=Mucilaginibacter roseus TaxID=1528868 RepID=A0ABS8U2J8_9SPHI|nr:hypothetical protein [Mucilaginibacter roseus]MCD8740268.1 hypothetical protein [Mucilaginibacter roseus]